MRMLQARARMHEAGIPGGGREQLSAPWGHMAPGISASLHMLQDFYSASAQGSWSCHSKE